MVYLHIPIAFNSIIHDGFSLKWQQVGEVENLYKLYKDYTTSRIQCVVIDMVLIVLDMLFQQHIHQRSIIGSFLFIWYVLGTPSCVPTLQSLMQTTLT